MSVKKKRIVCTVTNDLNQDQRMHRICATFYEAGYEVYLIGRKKTNSSPLLNFTFFQKRLFCFFQKGFLFYAEYNIRLAFYLLKLNYDICYSVDLDTILPGMIVSKTKNKKVIFDAHEYFAETPELQGRPLVKKIWNWIGNQTIPKVDLAITVNNSLEKLFSQFYSIPFHAIMNVPKVENVDIRAQINKPKPKILLYQGVLNQGRGLEVMIEAMAMIPNAILQIAGEGDLSLSLRKLASQSPAKERIHFLGWLSPDVLKIKTSEAYLGINLLEASSQNYYYSLANKFFDYIHAEIPAVHMAFPEYLHYLNIYSVGIAIESLDPKCIAKEINTIIDTEELWFEMHNQCKIAKKTLNWEIEEQKLLELTDSLIQSS